jgi:hypothetical protein
LTVDHASGWRGAASGLFARQHHQRMIDPPERAIAREAIEIGLNCGEWRKLPWNLPPLAPGRQHIQDSVHDYAQRDRTGPAARMAPRHKGFDQCPFRIGQIACVAQPIPAISRASDFSLGHRNSVRCCRSTESQPAGITQLSFSVRF